MKIWTLLLIIYMRRTFMSVNTTEDYCDEGCLFTSRPQL